MAEALAQRVAGIGASDIDLASITEKLSSSVYVADAGVLKAPPGETIHTGDPTTLPSSLNENFNNLAGDPLGIPTFGNVSTNLDETVRIVRLTSAVADREITLHPT